MPPQLLQKYIAYAQLSAAPALSAEAKEARPPLPMQWHQRPHQQEHIACSDWIGYLGIPCNGTVIEHLCGNMECKSRHCCEVSSKVQTCHGACSAPLPCCSQVNMRQ